MSGMGHKSGTLFYFRENFCINSIHSPSLEKRWHLALS